MIQQASGQWSVANTISTASVGIALLAVGVSFASRKTAKAALGIAQDQEDRRQQVFSVHLYEARRELRGEVWSIGIHVRLDNPADRPVTIVSADLAIELSRNGTSIKVKVPAALDGSDCLVGTEALMIPTKIEQNHGIAGCFMFRVPRELVAGGAIDGRHLVLEDVHGRTRSIKITLLGGME